MIEQLQKLKDNVNIKEYNDEPTNLLTIGDWNFSYCIENILNIQQKVLCISKTDGQQFQLSDIPSEVWLVFGDCGFWLCFNRVFVKRGYSLMFLYTGLK